MSCSSRSPESYVSYLERDSDSMPGVRYRIAKMSFARRLELLRRVREFAQRIEFLEARGEVSDRFESSVLSAEIDRLYLEWGLQAVSGLVIDGEEATPSTMIDRGPEDLAREIVRSIREECHLSEDERKN